MSSKLFFRAIGVVAMGVASLFVVPDASASTHRSGSCTVCEDLCPTQPDVACFEACDALTGECGNQQGGCVDPHGHFLPYTLSCGGIS